MNPQRIVKLSVSNIKRITAVSIDPKGNVVMIGGHNGAGKSSLLDSIAMALGGKEEFPDRPVRRGEAEGEIEIKLTDYTVTRSIAADGKTSLTVASNEGAKFPSPQAMLDRIVGALTFDPLSFTRLGHTEQYRLLRDLVKLDFGAIDAEIKAVFEERTGVNRLVKELRTTLENAGPLFEDAPDTEVSIAGLTHQLTQSQAINNSYADRRRRLGNMRESLAAKVDRRASVLNEIQQAENTLAILKRKDAGLAIEITEAERAVHAEADAIQSLQDIPLDEITKAIGEAEEVNRKVRANVARATVAEKLDAATTKAAVLTTKLETLDADKRGQLSAAKFPVDGLSIDLVNEGGVLFKGFPFSQASSAEQLRVSVAMGMALNPTLRVMCIRDGSLLDEDSMQMLADMAEAGDYQFWIETVDTTGPSTIVIEDGHVRTPVEVPQTAAA